jgi:ribosomal protein S16
VKLGAQPSAAVKKLIKRGKTEVAGGAQEKPAK